MSIADLMRQAQESGLLDFPEAPPAPRQPVGQPMDPRRALWAGTLLDVGNAFTEGSQMGRGMQMHDQARAYNAQLEAQRRAMQRQEYLDRVNAFQARLSGLGTTAQLGNAAGAMDRGRAARIEAEAEAARGPMAFEGTGMRAQYSNYLVRAARGEVDTSTPEYALAWREAQRQTQWTDAQGATHIQPGMDVRGFPVPTFGGSQAAQEGAGAVQSQGGANVPGAPETPLRDPFAPPEHISAGDTSGFPGMQTILSEGSDGARNVFGLVGSLVENELGLQELEEGQNYVPNTAGQMFGDAVKGWLNTSVFQSNDAQAYHKRMLANIQGITRLESGAQISDQETEAKARLYVRTLGQDPQGMVESRRQRVLDIRKAIAAAGKAYWNNGGTRYYYSPENWRIASPDLIRQAAEAEGVTVQEMIELSGLEPL